MLYSHISVKFFPVTGILLQNVDLQGKIATDILFCPSYEFCEDQGFYFLDDVTTFSFYFEMRYKEVINPKHYSTTIMKLILYIYGLMVVTQFGKTNVTLL